MDVPAGFIHLCGVRKHKREELASMYEHPVAVVDLFYVTAFNVFVVVELELATIPNDLGKLFGAKGLK